MSDSSKFPARVGTAPEVRVRDTNAVEVLKRSLEDAVAAEKAFEVQLRAMARHGDEPAVNRILSEHADETFLQHQRLAWRLEILGGAPSAYVNGFVAEAFNLPAKGGGAEDERGDKNLKNLVLAFAMENCEIAMYEELATVAALVGDVDTEQLARDIQMEERFAAERIWNQIAPSSVVSFSKETEAA